MSQYSTQFIKASSPSTGVLVLELARAPVNAFNDDFWGDLGATFNKVSLDGDIKAIVLASSMPKVFTAGLDLMAATAGLSERLEDTARTATKMRHHLVEFQAAITAIEKCSQPVIAAIHGIAYGLGIDITAACDIRYAATSASFSIKEVDVGLAADIGSLARLPKVTGNGSLLRELAFTARPFDAKEAYTLGLVSRVIEGGREEVFAAALETAKVIAAKSPIAVRGTKHILIHARDHSVQENLDYTAVWNQVMLQSDDILQSLEGFTKKRAPKFKPMPKL
ncbi:ClpP/crotonase [Clavulina sp. PMI_390]|nr:ClpP/crotonase [Clavulina sp. PMI_390]